MKKLIAAFLSIILLISIISCDEKIANNDVNAQVSDTQQTTDSSTVDTDVESTVSITDETETDTDTAEPTPCTHTLGEWDVLTPASERKNGEETRKCTIPDTQVILLLREFTTFFSWGVEIYYLHENGNEVLIENITFDNSSMSPFSNGNFEVVNNNDNTFTVRAGDSENIGKCYLQRTEGKTTPRAAPLQYPQLYKICILYSWIG